MDLREQFQRLEKNSDFVSAKENLFRYQQLANSYHNHKLSVLFSYALLPATYLIYSKFKLAGPVTFGAPLAINVLWAVFGTKSLSERYERTKLEMDAHTNNFHYWVRALRTQDISFVREREEELRTAGIIE